MWIKIPVLPWEGPLFLFCICSLLCTQPPWKQRLESKTRQWPHTVDCKLQCLGLAGPVSAAAGWVGGTVAESSSPARPQPPPSSRGVLLLGSSHDSLPVFIYHKAMINNVIIEPESRLFSIQKTACLLSAIITDEQIHLWARSSPKAVFFFVSLIFKCTIFSIFTVMQTLPLSLIPENCLHCKRECPNH